MRYLSLLLLLPGLTLVAQDYAHDLSGITKVIITVETDIEVYAQSSDSLRIPEKDNERRKRPAEAAGLVSLNTRGQDNTNYGVEISQEGSQLIVKGLRNRLGPDLTLYLPPDVNVSVEVLNNNDIYIEGFQSEIEAINHNGEIILKNITGPIITENSNGNTLAVFTEINQDSPSSLVATSGDIIVRLPPDASISISGQARRGEFLTDFEVDLTQTWDPKDYRRSIAGTINGGGVLIDLHSVHGNIYVRKQK